MRMLEQIRSRESGYALPIVLLVTTLALILAASASFSALSATDTAGRDVRSKQAVMAAEAGLDAAMAHANNLSLDLDHVLDLTQQCVVSTSGTLSVVVPTTGEWCTTVTENLGTGAKYEYRVSPVAHIGSGLPAVLVGNWNGVLGRKIVSTGSIDCPGIRCVRRRLYVEITANASATGISLLGLNVLSSLNLQLYRRVAGTFRECTPVATGSSPDSGCS